MKNTSVPVLKQQSRLTCGITALRMVFLYFGKNISSKRVIKEIGGIKTYGVRTIKLADFAEKSGFKTECFTYNKKLSKGKAKIKKPDKPDIIKFLKRNIPVILAVKSHVLYEKKSSKMGHFIVITKYENKAFWYNDPHDGKQHKIKDDKLMIALVENALDSSAYLLAIKPKKSIL